MTEQNVIVTENGKIAENTYRMKLKLAAPIKEIRAGQFLTVSTGDRSRLLKRPFGIEWYNEAKDEVAFCYQVVGNGTEALKEMKPGEVLEAVLPLGNGFFLDKEHEVALIGGGAGVFPLATLPLFYNRDMGGSVNFHAYFGFRNKAIVSLEDELKDLVDLHIATDDGSYGYKGFAIDLFLKDRETVPFDAILACGPKPMLSALKRTLERENIKTPCFVSMEERMGCGIGACLVCVCKNTKLEKNVRICKDGPVFDIKEVEL